MRRHLHNSQEPKTTGNTGNTGNDLVGRGLQPLPPYKKSGNRWQHKLVFADKQSAQPCVSVLSVARENRVATNWKQFPPLEASPFGAVASVASVAGAFAISGT